MNRAEVLRNLEHDSAVLMEKVLDVHCLILALAEDVDRESISPGDALHRARQVVKAIETRQQMLAPEVQRLNEMILQVAAHAAQVEALSSDGKPTYANLRWTARDVQLIAGRQGIDLTQEQADRILADHEDTISDAASARGWETISLMLGRWTAELRAACE